MKRILLTLSAAAALVLPFALLAGSAGADSPFGPPPDSSAECGGSSGGKPAGQCSDVNLPQSMGCEAGQSGSHNPHCLPAQTTTTTTNPPAPVTTPVATPVAPQAPSGVAGTEVGKKKGAGPAGVAGTAGGSQQIEQLPFTGLETLWLALIGAGMLALGLVLRVRLASHEAGASESDSPVACTEATVAPDGDAGDGFPLSGFETLGLMLIRTGGARLRAGPQGKLVVALTPG
jgi:hypothetical protein